MTTLPYFGARIRPGESTDLDPITRIYAHHILTGTGSFEEVPPDRDEMAARFHAVRETGLPYLVADVNGRIVGYAYASLYRLRSAYRFTVEDSVYMDPEYMGQGVGRALLGRVVAGCARLGYRQMLALIGDSANERSIRLHRSLEFEQVGVQRMVGLKFNRWLDVVLMQRALGPGGGALPSEDPLRPLRG